MIRKITQEQRLEYLVEEFKADSGEYKDLQTPIDVEGKRRILRSLMNIRMPRELPNSVLEVQDEYLTERAEEKGVVRLSDIPVMQEGLSIWQGDITRLKVDAIVNAANSQMLGCFVPMHTCIDNCIHIVGPIVSGWLTPALEQDLADCYTNTLNLCAENGLRSVAFCCISTGVFGFPQRRAAEIAVQTVRDWMQTHIGQIDCVIFNVFKDEDRKYYEALL